MLTYEEFIKRLSIANNIINNVYKSINTTHIPFPVYIQYLKDEIGLDLHNIKV